MSTSKYGHASVVFTRGLGIKENRAAARLAYKVNLKLDVMSYYGPAGKPKCSWVNCEIDDIDMLALDHVDNSGHIDKKIRGTGVLLYTRLRGAGFPAGFQTLCCNHNQKKETMRARGLAW